MFRSEDRGETWEHVGLDSVVVRALALGDDGRLLAGSYTSDTGGETWTYLGESMQSTDVLTLAVAPDGHAWAGTYGGGVYRSSRPTVDAESGDPAPDGPALRAAYPNPFRDATTLALTLGHTRERVAVEVFDVLGRRVEVLHDGPLAAGQHDFTFDGRSLPAGVYVVRVAGDGLAQSQRVVLLR